jgi:hypothetical protein
VGAGQSSRSGTAGSHPEVGRAESRPLRQRSWALGKAAAAAVWVRTRKLDGPNRARCDSDCGAGQSSRSGTAGSHPEVGRAETGTGMTKGDTVPSAPLRGSANRVPRSWVFRARGTRLLRRTASSRSGRASLARGSKRLTCWDWLGGRNWHGWIDLAGFCFPESIMAPSSPLALNLLNFWLPRSKHLGGRTQRWKADCDRVEVSSSQLLAGIRWADLLAVVHGNSLVRGTSE